MPSFSSFITEMLWTEALETVVPSSSTESKMATGLIRPVREADHSISLKVVSAVSSCHLKAMESLGNLAVTPRDLPYSMSFKETTSPSEGTGFSAMLSANHFTVSSTVSPVISLCSTTWKPWAASQSNCSFLVTKSFPSAETSEKAKNLTLRCFVMAGSSCRTDPEQRFLGFLYFAPSSVMEAFILSNSS